MKKLLSCILVTALGCSTVFAQNSQQIGVSKLKQLKDVSASSPSNGQTLIYNSSTGKWTSGSASLLTANVGISSANPGKELDVTGSIRASGTISTGNGTATIVGDSNGNVGIGSLVPGSTLDVTGNIRGTGFIANGNVGINSTCPNSKIVQVTKGLITSCY